MEILEYLKSNLLFLDGGMGTLLQEKGLSAGELPERWNITHPDVITEIHKNYYDAGSNVVCTNTFGASTLKFSPKELEEIIKAAVSNAKKARDASHGAQKKFIALDIGPSGKLLKPYGDLDFEDAVGVFSQTVRLGAKYGVDLILIETMNDSYETKAALLAAKESSSLPVFVTNAYGEDGKLMTGASPEAMCALLEGMGGDAIGANCSLGPKQLTPIIDRLLAVSSLPVIIKANAGLPKSIDGKTVYDVRTDEFASDIAVTVKHGARIIGGCCGTTPSYISALREKCAPLSPVPTKKKEITLISSYTNAVIFGNAPILIGERINPTGKKRFKEALRANDVGYILAEALKQQECGVSVLDVNVGLPEIDEKQMLTSVIKELQAVTDLPLQIDTSDPDAMESAMRIYNGKPMVNSVNGKEESMRAVFPLVKKYGGLAVALTLDENGIPDTAEGRLAIAKKILSVASEYGVEKKDIIFDPLTLTVSADKNAAAVTLRSVELIKKELGCLTTLGVSNVSFGLPSRDTVTSVFFSCAMERGLDAAIMNPYCADMLKSYYSFCALKGIDDNCEKYIEFASTLAVEQNARTAVPTAPKAQGKQYSSELCAAIVKGLKERARELCADMLKATPALDIVNEHIIPALDEVGDGFEKNTVYLPQLLMSAEAAKYAFEPIRESLANSAESRPQRLTVVLATVKGDIHDIGKNIVKLLLENYGFTVIDLGKDVPAETVVETAVKNGVSLVGLSALMTTTVPAMEETIRLLRQRLPECRVVVGGAVLNEEYARRIGADKYAKDAMESVRYAEELEAELKK